MENTCGYPDCKENVVHNVIGCSKHWDLLPATLQLSYRESNPGDFKGRAADIDSIVSFWTEHWCKQNPKSQEEINSLGNTVSEFQNSYFKSLVELAPPLKSFPNILKKQNDISEAIEDLESSLCRAARDLERLKRLVQA